MFKVVLRICYNQLYKQVSPLLMNSMKVKQNMAFAKTIGIFIETCQN